MSNIIGFLIAPLGWLLYITYSITGNVGWSIIIFSIVAKIVLFPVMRMAHLNSIRLLRLQPELSAIKKRYPHDKEQLNEEQYNLFQRENYSPLVGVIPLLVQLVLLMSMLQVMYDPLLHMRLPQGTDLSFFGVDLGEFHIVMPFLSGAAALMFSLVQNAISPGALSQGKWTNIGLIIFTVALSIYFAAVTPAGVGLYWTVGNLFAIVTVTLLYHLYNPYKLAAEALAFKKAEQKTPVEVKQERELDKINKAREKTDAERYMSAEKRLVFFALTGGQYKYYKTVIDYLLSHSDIPIHYLTNDPDDTVFTNDNPKIIPYYAGHKKTISLMLKLECDMLVTTVPDLQTFHIKRSIAKKNIEYLYIFHGPFSTHMGYKERAFDYFDTLFCVGAHHAAELRRREDTAKLPKRNLVRVGYSQYDILTEKFKKFSTCNNVKPRLLIAPSWQADNIFETCIDELIDNLVGKGYEIFARPHPQLIRLFPSRMDALVKRYADYIAMGEIVFDLDFSSNNSILTSDMIITDWSGIAYEFSYCTLRPCLFINTPVKVYNPNYKKYGLEPIEISARDKLGISIDPLEISDKAAETVEYLLHNKASYEEQIKESMSQYLYHPSRSGEAGGKYIISRLSNKKIKSDKADDENE